jgi:putative tricarboxylic transport membrane protein
MEENFRRALLMSRGDLSTFIESPVSATLLIIAAAMLVLALLPNFRSSRDKVFAE